MPLPIFNTTESTQRGFLLLSILYFLFVGIVLQKYLPEYSHDCIYRNSLGGLSITILILSFIPRFKPFITGSVYFFSFLCITWVLHEYNVNDLSPQYSLLFLGWFIVIASMVRNRKIFLGYLTIVSLVFLFLTFRNAEPQTPRWILISVYFIILLITYLIIENFRRIQGELRSNNLKMKLLLDEVDECFLLISKTGEVLQFNKKAYDTFQEYHGINIKVGDSFKSLFKNTDYNFENELSQSFLGSSVKLDHQAIYYLEEGIVTKWYEIKFLPIEEKDINVDKVLFTALDITDRYEASQRLIRSKEKFKELFHKAPIGMAIARKDGVVVDANKAYFETVGYPKEEVLNKTFAHYTHPDDLDQNYFLLQKFLRREIPEYQLEKRYIQKNGSLITVIVKVILIRDVDGGDQLLAQVIDITNLKSAKEDLRNQNFQLQRINNDLEISNGELEKANMELDRFIYSASHDLKAPLTSLLGLINLSRMENPSNTMYLDLMEKSVKRLNTFIEEVINFSLNARTEIQNDKIEDIENVFNESFENLRFSNPSNIVTLEVKNNIHQKFYVDLRRLEVITNNLLSNSIKYQDYSKKDKFIKIESSLEQNDLHLVISDNGIGIPEERLSKIFDFFYRAHDHSKGSGLGLYIVKQTIQKMGGSIDVESAERLGTTMRISIPVKVESYAQEASQ